MAKQALNISRKPTTSTGNKAVPPAEKSSGLSITVHEAGDIGVYKGGDVLTVDRHIADFWRLTYKSTEADDADKMDRATTPQIIEVLKATDVKGLVPADANQRYLDALAAASFAMDDLSRIPTMEAVAEGSPSAIAMAVGSRLDAASVGTLKKGIDGNKDYNACPIEMADSLTRQFGHLNASFQQIEGAKEGVVHANSVLNAFPPIGTRYTGSKHDKAPYGYGVPQRGDKHPDGTPMPVYNGPWHHYKDDNRTGNVNVIADFVSAFPGDGGHDWLLLGNQLRAIASKDGVPLQGTPAHVLELKHDIDKLKGVIRDVAFEYDKRVRIMTRALHLLQRKRDIREHFSTEEGHIYVGFSRDDATPAERARATLPFRLVTVKYGAGNEGRDVEAGGKYIALGTVLGIEPKRWPANTKAATLIEPKKRGTNANAEKGKDQSGARLPEINTSDMLTDYLLPVCNYIDDGQHYNSILARIRDNKDGGLLASTLIRVHSDLTSLVNNPDVVRLANDYETRNKDAASDEAKAKPKAA